MSNAHPSNSVYLGIDLSSRHIRAGAIDSTGKLLHFRRQPQDLTFGSMQSGRALADKLLNTTREAIAAQDAPVAAIGVGFPGLINHATNRIARLPNAPSLAEIDLYHEFTEAFGLPVVFENNTNAATIAEMKQGVGQSVSDLLYLRIGQGIGAGLVLDGKLRRGKSGYAGEIGHVNVDPEGVECSCGSRGCLETICSAPNIVRRTRARLERDKTSSLSEFERRDEDFTYDDIIKAAHEGDDLALLMMQRTGHFIGMVVADMINVLNLSMVVIAGNSAARPLLIPAIAEEAERRSFSEAFADCQIVAGKLASEAGVIGAALLAQDAVK
ncbi:MAG TPA: ROK family protein [Blastocatellia bacterium]|nr:ROK family protein [Blastocatellia bacterium]